MLVKLAISCQPDSESGESELGLLRSALHEFSVILMENGEMYYEGKTSERVIEQIRHISVMIEFAMQKTLEGLQPMAVSDGKGGYRKVYADQSDLIDDSDSDLKS